MMPTEIIPDRPTTPRGSAASRATLSGGSVRLPDTFVTTSAPLAETPKGRATVSAGTSSRPSIRDRVSRIVRHAAWVWVGDIIGALSLFVLLFGLLWIGEIFG